MSKYYVTSMTFSTSRPCIPKTAKNNVCIASGNQNPKNEFARSVDFGILVAGYYVCTYNKKLMWFKTKRKVINKTPSMPAINEMPMYTPALRPSRLTLCDTPTKVRRVLHSYWRSSIDPLPSPTYWRFLFTTYFITFWTKFSTNTSHFLWYPY